MTKSTDDKYDASKIQKKRITGWDIWDKWKYTLFVLPIVLGAYFILAPDEILIKDRRNEWKLKECALLGSKGQEYLLVHLEAQETVRSPIFTWIATLNAQDGQMLGEYVISNLITNLGLERGRIWLREPGLGSIYDTRNFALSLPALEEVPGAVLPDSKKLGSLRSPGCEAPAPPRKIKGNLVLDGEFVCDRRTGNAVDLGNHSLLLAHQTLQDTQGKLILTSLYKKNEPLWNLEEKQWIGERDFDEPGYRVAWATKINDGIILVMPQAENAGELHMACLDPMTGQLIWRRSAP